MENIELLEKLISKLGIVAGQAAYDKIKAIKEKNNYERI
jgi:hypothetical protein